MWQRAASAWSWIRVSVICCLEARIHRVRRCQRLHTTFSPTYVQRNEEIENDQSKTIDARSVLEPIRQNDRRHQSPAENAVAYP